MSEMIRRVAHALRTTGGVVDPLDAEALARIAIEAMRSPTRPMMSCLYTLDWPVDRRRGKQAAAMLNPPLSAVRSPQDEVVPHSSECELLMGQYQRMIDAALELSLLRQRLS